MAIPVLSDLDDDELIWRNLDGMLTDDEFVNFNERLRTDSGFRRHYANLADLHATLHDKATSNESSPLIASSTRTSRFRTLVFIKGSLATLACMAVFVAGWFSLRTDEVQNGDPRPVVESGGVSPALPKRTFVADVAVEAPTAAVITRVSTSDYSGLFVGLRLRPGILNLDEGQVQIEFFGGAVIAVTGPAELHIRSKDAATLLSGQVSAYVPERARGFVLNAPNTAVVDLGTEFGLRVDKDGASEVEVMSGEIEVSLLGDDGNTLHSQRIGEATNLRIDQLNKRLTVAEPNSVKFPVVQLTLDTSLPVNDAYVDAILECQPFVYWRFEDIQGDIIVNEMGDHCNAVVHTPDDHPKAIRIESGHLRLERSAGARYLISDSAFLEFNSKPYTMEFWMRPNSLDHATCVGCILDDGATKLRHVNVVEVVTDTHLVHQPGSIRFLHRNPANLGPEGDTNLFTHGACAPGRWQHVAVVAGNESLELFFNGRLARRIMCEDLHAAGAYHILLGQTRTNMAYRQFCGAMDELALYGRALSASEIRHHYELIMQE